jgi:hypothetical protein
MMISDRYSCQEHGKDIQQLCLSCEIYSDILTLDKRIAELELALSTAINAKEQAEIQASEARQATYRQALLDSHERLAGLEKENELLLPLAKSAELELVEEYTKGKRDGMERAAQIVENSHHTGGNVFEQLARAIRDGLDKS